MAVSYIVPGEKMLYAQPNTMACWATAYTMMNSWKNQECYADIRSAISSLGQPWLGYFDRNTGVPPSEGRRFESATGLTREPRMNLTPTGWESYLRSYGLMWVSGTIVGGGIHDRVLEGIGPAGTVGNHGPDCSSAHSTDHEQAFGERVLEAVFG